MGNAGQGLALDRHAMGSPHTHALIAATPASDIDTVVDSLKVLDPKRPIREADNFRFGRHFANAPKAEMRCHLYFRTSTFLDFRLLLKQGERTKHEEHDLARRLRRTQRNDSIICARFHQVPCREALSKA